MRPKSSNALQWRGYAFERLGDRDRALADDRAALEARTGGEARAGAHCAVRLRLTAYR